MSEGQTIEVDNSTSKVFCPERNCVIEKSFCRYVCSTERNCPFHQYFKPVSDECHLFQPYPVPDMEPLGVSMTYTTGRNLNIIQEHYFEDPILTKHHVNYLRLVSWVDHKRGLRWPKCNCLACCSDLIFKVMEASERKGIKRIIGDILEVTA